MMTTIACPMDLTHDAVNPDTAPVWVDALGNQYRVASGLLSGIEPTEETTVAPDRITVAVGMDGLSALALMGLSLPSADDSDPAITI